MIERRRSARWLVVLVAALAVILGISNSALARTTSTDAGSFTYDAPAATRVDARAFSDATADGTQLGGVLERHASPSRPAQGASTTSLHSFIATEAAALADDHIVLGLRASGLEETAAKVGGRTLLSDPQWQTSLQQAIGTPGTRFTVALDGLSGSTPYSQVMSAVQNGVTPLATPTNWELAQLFQAGRIGDVTFVSGGRVVPNPWGG